MTAHIAFRFLVCSIVVMWLPGTHLPAADWPQFRGSNGLGVADTAGLPEVFGPEKNVLWKTALPPGHSSPVIAEERIFVTAYEGEKLLTLCLDRESGPNGRRGDLTDTNVLWRYRKSLPNTPSPLLYKGVIYMVKGGGIVTSLDAARGTVLKQARVREAVDDYWASVVAGDDKVFLVSQSCAITVLSAEGEWNVLATNRLADECFATPAIADGRIYVRTLRALYSFGRSN